MTDINNFVNNIISFCSLIILYTEIHYKFKFFGSRYYIKEPEIISDLPIRIEPGKMIPILILIKDSNIFPISLLKVCIKIYKNNKIIKSKNIIYDLYLNKHWWSDIIYIETKNILGQIDIDVILEYRINKKYKEVHIHNYPNCSHNLMSTYVSQYAYPNDGEVNYGDLHCHTNLTEDMVEFGAPILRTLQMAEAMGLDFYCTTDHSYDLDDIKGSWIKTDPELKKWNRSRLKIKSINNNSKFKSFIIPAEELTLHNSRGENIHALILNNSEFIPGSGDGAEKPFNFNCDFNTDTIHQVLQPESLYIAAHPFENVPWLQKLFFKRGMWRPQDINYNNMRGLQILNGSINETFYKSIKIWIQLLLNGQIKYIYAGNDAHGNFNIFRQIKIPMISIAEKKEQIFGHFRTGVVSETGNKNINLIIKNLYHGNCFITNGPIIKINFISNNIVFPMGSISTSKEGKLKIFIKSTSEFGSIKKIILKKGIINSKNEINLFTAFNLKSYEFNKTIKIQSPVECYIRCEAEFNSNKKIISLTNPIWISCNKN